MSYFFIFVAFALVLAAWLTIGYNALVRLKLLMQEGWSGIDIQLKRRYDLIPNLVATVKQYSSYEKDVFESVTRARTASMDANSIASKSDAETQLSTSLRSLFAVAESYPELKANESYLSLQNELSSIESEIQLSRRYYNGATRNYNIKVQSFPSNVIASLMGFHNAEYFQIAESERDVVEVKLT